MKRKLSTILALVLMLSTIFSVNVFAAVSYPTISSSNYIEFKAQQNINVYKDTACKTRGTSSPAKQYNASIAKNDVCYIYKITSSYIQVNYPTSSGRRTGYIKRANLFDKTAPEEYISSAKASVTVYKADGSSNIAKGDKVWRVDPKNGYEGYRAVIYEAKSGKRAYKMGYIKTNDFNLIKNSTTASKSTNSTLHSPVPEECYFNKKTSDCGGSNWYGYHDINQNVSSSTPVYAIADGTIKCSQKYTTINKNEYLVSYGNLIEFTSSDKVYTAKYAHLSKFNGITQRISSKNTKQLSASECSNGVKTYTLVTNKKVSKGEIIGYIGTTGNSSGNHLHFELYKNGSRIDPTTIISGLTR